MHLKPFCLSVAFAILLGTSLLAFRTNMTYASNTIYILPDGSINPPTANISTSDQQRYVFTGNVNDSVIVQRSNIILDGAGYSLIAPASDQALYLYYQSNVTIANMSIQQCRTGILLEHCSFCVIVNNVLANNSWHAIRLDTSSNNTIRRNSVMDNSNRAMMIDGSADNAIEDNTIVGNYRGIEMRYEALRNSVSGNNISRNDGPGISLELYSNDNIIAGNNLTGNHGGIALGTWSSNNTISGNTLRNDLGTGLTITQSPHCTVTDNEFIDNAYGIRLMYVNTTQLRNNQMSNSSYYNFGLYFTGYSDFLNDVDLTNTVNGKPIYYWVDKHGLTVPADAGIVILQDCTDIRIQNLNFTDTVYYAVVIGYSSNVTVAGCYVESSSFRSEYCVWLWNASDCTIEGSYLHGFIGIQLDHSLNNTIHDNTLTGSGNQGAVNFRLSESNVFYHNNFTGNLIDVFPDAESMNQWDNGYPEGGNYWDNYVERMASPRDERSGPGQDQPGADGFWDLPYPIDDRNVDHYPVVSENPTLLLMTALLSTLVVTALVLRRKHLIAPRAHATTSRLGQEHPPRSIRPST